MNVGILANLAKPDAGATLAELAKAARELLIEVAGTYNLLYNTIFFIEAGMGSALCFKGMADAVGSSRGLVFRPLDPVIYSANYVVWRRDQVFSRAGRLVVVALDEAFSHHA